MVFCPPLLHHSNWVYAGQKNDNLVIIKDWNQAKTLESGKLHFKHFCQVSSRLVEKWSISVKKSDLTLNYDVVDWVKPA